SAPSTSALAPSNRCCPTRRRRWRYSWRCGSPRSTPSLTRRLSLLLAPDRGRAELADVSRGRAQRGHRVQVEDGVCGCARFAGFAGVSPLAAAWTLEISTAIPHLRDVLRDQTYESLAHQGKTMTRAAMVTYAYDQIDQARTELEHPS